MFVLSAQKVGSKIAQGKIQTTTTILHLANHDLQFQVAIQDSAEDSAVAVIAGGVKNTSLSLVVMKIGAVIRCV